MADALNGTGQTPATANNAPGQLTSTQIDPAEYSRLREENASLQREAAKVKGFQPFYEKAKTYGFDKPESFDEYGPIVKAVRERGVTSQDFLRAFGQAKDENPEQSASMTIKDVEAMLGTKLAEHEKKIIREQAEKEKTNGFTSDYSEMSEAKIAEALGSGVPDPFKKAAVKLVMQDYYERCKFYPEGHPLAGTLAPGGRDAYAAAIAFAKDTFSGTATALKASHFAEIGDAARSTKSTTTTGKSGISGEPPKKDARETPKDRTRRYIGEAAGKLGITNP